MTATSLSRSAPAAIAIGLLGVGGAACRTEAPPTARVVEIHDMAFDPAVLEARPGDTLVWVNRDIFPHTVTAADASWSSPPLGQGERWRVVADANAAGTYGCRFHPSMEGRIILTTGREGGRMRRRKSRHARSSKNSSHARSPERRVETLPTRLPS